MKAITIRWVLALFVSMSLIGGLGMSFATADEAAESAPAETQEAPEETVVSSEGNLEEPVQASEAEATQEATSAPGATQSPEAEATQEATAPPEEPDPIFTLHQECTEKGGAKLTNKTPVSATVKLRGDNGSYLVGEDFVLPPGGSKVITNVNAYTWHAHWIWEKQDYDGFGSISPCRDEPEPTPTPTPTPTPEPTPTPTPTPDPEWKVNAYCKDLSTGVWERGEIPYHGILNFHWLDANGEMVFLDLEVEFGPEMEQVRLDLSYLPPNTAINWLITWVIAEQDLQHTGSFVCGAATPTPTPTPTPTLTPEPEPEPEPTPTPTLTPEPEPEPTPTPTLPTEPSEPSEKPEYPDDKGESDDPGTNPGTDANVGTDPGTNPGTDANVGTNPGPKKGAGAGAPNPPKTGYSGPTQPGAGLGVSGAMLALVLMAVVAIVRKKVMS